MKISFDLDGTAKKYPAHFGWLAKSFKDTGHEVGILTARGFATQNEDLLQIEQATNFTYDFYVCYDMKYLQEELAGNGIWKAKMMSVHGIDLHFDDFGKNKKESKNKFLTDFTHNLEKGRNYVRIK